MGLHVAAIDVTDEKLALARSLGADFTVNARANDAAEQVIKATSGGAHGVTGDCRFDSRLRAGPADGTAQGNGQPEWFATRRVPDIDFRCRHEPDHHPGGRSSALGRDLAEAVAFAVEGKVKAHIHKAKLEDINKVFSDLSAGKIDGRVVLTL